jgi:hypothetical protein
MKILNPPERLAAEARIAEISKELGSLPKPRSDQQAQRAAELDREMAELTHKLIGIGPPAIR